MVEVVILRAVRIENVIFIAVGLGVRHSYDLGSFTANVVSGVLDSASCGILIFSGLVELLAKDLILLRGRRVPKGWF